MKELIVTGSSGFIGYNFVDHVLKTMPDAYDRVIGFSRTPNSRLDEPLRQKASEKKLFVEYPGNLLDPPDTIGLLAGESGDFIDIVHLAANAFVADSFKEPEKFIMTNTLGTFNLLNAARKSKAKINKLVFISSEEIFGLVPEGQKRKPSDTPDPMNPYSASKAAAEDYVKAWSHSYDLNTSILRLTNNYGPRQPAKRLMAKLIINCLTNNSFELFEGGSKKNWMYIHDTVRAIATVLTHQTSPGSIYGAGTHINRYAIPEVADVIMEQAHQYLGTDTKKLFTGFKAGRLQDEEQYDQQSLELEALGWKELFNLERGIKTTIEWYHQNQWFWNADRRQVVEVTPTPSSPTSDVQEVINSL